MKVVLMGYMASGKSAVGKKLAQNLCFQFIDLDAFIEQEEGITISEMFKTKGEIYFRIKEGEYLKKILKKNTDMVISLGGGTPCYGKNIELIKNSSTSIYLKSSIKTIFNRIKNETAQRPLVAEIGIDNLQEYIAKHLFERTNFYEQANFTVATDAKTVNEICLEINNLL
jgi:shikimate kinase